MSCMKSDSPIDITANKSAGACNLKCDFKYDYHPSACSIKNRGTYLSIEYDRRSASSAPVYYNENPYNVSEIRIYSPSLHSYNGQKESGELIVVHTPVKGGKQFLVCVPIRTDSYSSGPASKVIEKTVRALGNNAQSEGDSATISVTPTEFNLNNFVPQAPFYSYTARAPYSPCLNKVIILVFEPSYSKITLPPKIINAFRGFIKAHHYTVKKRTLFFFNQVGSVHKNIGDEIYIDCKPVGASTDQTTITRTSVESTSTKKPFWTRPAFQDTMDVFTGMVIFGGVLALTSTLYSWNVKQNKK